MSYSWLNCQVCVMWFKELIALKLSFKAQKCHIFLRVCIFFNRSMLHGLLVFLESFGYIAVITALGTTQFVLRYWWQPLPHPPDSRGPSSHRGWACGGPFHLLAQKGNHRRRAGFPPTATAGLCGAKGAAARSPPPPLSPRQPLLPC